MKATLTWGAVAAAMVWSGLAAAQIPPTPSTVPAPAASGAPGAPPAPSVAPPADATVPPPPVTEPTPPEVAPVPPAPAAEQATAAEEAAVEDRPKKRKKKRKRRYEEEQYEAEEDADPEEHEREEEEPEPRRMPSWRLGGQHFVLSAERLSSVLTWSQSIKQEISNGSFPSSTTTLEAETAGTDVGFLGAGAFDRNPFSIPRVGFDGIFANGFTLGGSLSYIVSSAETTQPDGINSSTKRELATQSIFLLSPRVGVLIPTSAQVGIWLRGGITRLNLSSEPGAGSSNPESSVTFWDLTLDPQLVISPVPHIGITIGAALDIGIAGTIDSPTNSSTTSVEPELSASSYGVTAGLAAIF
jgi:hypothetical protein